MGHNTTANERIYIAAAACQRIRDSLISEPWSSKVRKELKSSALNDKRAFWANANVTLARLPVTVVDTSSLFWQVFFQPSASRAPAISFPKVYISYYYPDASKGVGTP